MERGRIEIFLSSPSDVQPERAARIDRKKQIEREEIAKLSRLAWTSLDGQPTNNIMLSNDNLCGEPSAEVVVRPDDLLELSQ